MLYLLKWGCRYLKSSISKISSTFSAKRFISDVYYSPLWEVVSPRVSPQQFSIKGVLVKGFLIIFCVHSLSKLISKTLTMAKTRNHPTPASSSKKRPRTEPTERVIIDTTVEELESSNHSVEDILSSDDDSAADPILKKSRYAIKFINTKLETRYRDYNFVNRKVIYSKSVVGSEFVECGLVDIFDSIGMRSLIDLPDVCYPFLVREFYANLHEPSNGRYVSRVRDQGIVLNATILNGMLEFKNLTDDLIVPLTKKGICDLFEDLPELEQHALVRGDIDNTDVSLPTTSMLEPMAHLLFKICRTNISPRVGSRSLLTC